MVYDRFVSWAASGYMAMCFVPKHTFSIDFPLVFGEHFPNPRGPNEQCESLTATQGATPNRERP